MLCFERISQELPAFCTARGGGSNGIGGGNTHNMSRARTAHEAGCADIRRLYAEDAALHDRHCARSESDFGAAGSSISTSAHSAPSSVAFAREVSSRLPPRASSASSSSSASAAASCASRMNTAILLVGLAGAAPQLHIRSLAALQTQLDASVVVVGEGHEAALSGGRLEHIRLLGHAVASLGLISDHPLPRPPYLHASSAYTTLPPPPTPRRLAVASQALTRNPRQRHHDHHHHDHEHHEHRDLQQQRQQRHHQHHHDHHHPGSSGQQVGGAGVGTAGRPSNGASKFRQGAKAQWYKVQQAWALMEDVETTTRNGARFDMVLKVRFDATPLPPFRPCLPPHSDGSGGRDGSVLFAATDKIFWGGRAAMAVAARLGASIEHAFEGGSSAASVVGRHESSGTSAPAAVRAIWLRRLVDSAEPLPLSAWSTAREVRQHYNKLAMLPVPVLAGASASRAALSPSPTISATMARAATLRALRDALARADGVAPFSAATPTAVRAFARTPSTVTASSLPSAVPPITLAAGVRSSAVDRMPNVFVAERDFLIWLLWHNVTVCDLGGGGERILYKGVVSARPSVPCPSAEGEAKAGMAAGARVEGVAADRRGIAAATKRSPSPFAPTARRPRVHIYHGKRIDGRLGYMYAPIVRTLVRGFNSTTAHEDGGGGSGAVVVHVGEVDASAEPTSAFQREMLRLGERDTFVWVGMKQHGTPPWAQLRARGVFTIYYQTEPLPRSGVCILPPSRRAAPPDPADAKLVDEVWDYSQWNVAQCEGAAHAPRIRHVPPGAFAEPYTITPAPSGSSAGRGVARALFLGDPTLEERPKCFAPLSRLVTTVNDVWTDEALRRQFLISASAPPIFVNLHKRCLHDEAAQPLEAVRISQLLSAGGLVLSQRAAARDEVLFSGIVNFSTLADMPSALSALLARSDLRELARRRNVEFRTRFRPERLVGIALEP